MYSRNEMRGKATLSLSFLPILAVLSFILLLVVPADRHGPRTTSSDGETAVAPPSKLHVSEHVQLAHATCDGTLYPELCAATLSSLLPTLPSAASLVDIIAAAVNIAILEVRSTESNCSGVRLQFRDDLGLRQRRAFDDCTELFEDTVSELRVAVKDLGGKSFCGTAGGADAEARSSNCTGAHKTRLHVIHELETLLSAAITNQYTCLDGFANGGEAARRVFERRLLLIGRLVSNSLAMLKKVPVAGGASSGSAAGERGFPAWVSRKDRRLLQQAPAAGTKFDLVVAKDGTGNFTTVGAAVAAAPNSSTTRFVIYIKAGAYFENVEVEKKKTKLMFVGDGIGKTVIKASRSVGGNWTTFRSATVAVVGDGFLAKGITVENSAGPSNHQAVALRSGSDLSAFYQCSFVGYQDTLYVHSSRQFYRDCDVYGTVDFVFGNAAAVLQNCNLYARQPNPNQKNIFTAQGREDPNQNTGIALINCKIAAAADLVPVQSSFKSYLGRPWKQYSRTVVLRSQIDGLIEPAGWLEWDGDFALKTLFYGEYMNRGAGANTSGRVTWPGYRVINSSTVAATFTAGAFVQGGEWLNATGFPFYLGLA